MTPIATVQRRHGVPTIYINGQPFTGWSYLRAIERYPGFDQYDWGDLERDYRQQAEAGAGLFQIHSNCAGDFYKRLWGDVWRADGTFDFSHLDRFMEILTPGVWVLPNINMFLPTWWDDRHPDELLRFADGRTRAKFTGESAACRDQTVSLASEKWVADMTMCLERYLDYAESRYGDRIVGYLICGGITHEWGVLGSFDFVDYSAPMVRYWRDWVARRYAGHPPYDGTVIPSRDLRERGAGRIRNPVESRAAIDFQLCLSDLVVDRITGFCETVKRRTQGRKLTATFYGYTISCREGGLKFLGRYGCGGFQGGHLALHRLLQSPAIDMITSPPTYLNRRLGTGDMQPHYPETSVTRAGKVSYFQDDNRSWKGYDQKTIDTGYYPEPENFLKQLRRSFARRLCGDDQFYLTDLLGRNYDDPRVIAELQLEQRIFDQYADRRASALGELLVVVDETAIAHLTLSSDLHMQNIYQQSAHWARCGVPYHVVLVEDAATMDLAPYRLVLLCNSVAATEPVMTLARRCRESGVQILALPDCVSIGVEQASRAPVEWSALGEFAAQAGCHRYGTRGERIWRSPAFLGVHVDAAGEYTLSLPPGIRVEAEVLAGCAWRQDGAQLHASLEQWDTAVFTLSPM